MDLEAWTHGGWSRFHFRRFDQSAKPVATYGVEWNGRVGASPAVVLLLAFSLVDPRTAPKHVVFEGSQLDLAGDDMSRFNISRLYAHPWACRVVRAECAHC